MNKYSQNFTPLSIFEGEKSRLYSIHTLFWRLFLIRVKVTLPVNAKLSSYLDILTHNRSHIQKSASYSNSSARYYSAMPMERLHRIFDEAAVHNLFQHGTLQLATSFSGLRPQQISIGH